MNDEQFTPTTRQVRDGYRFDPIDDYHDPVNAGANAERNGRAFDRWLRRHEEKVMAEAWDELVGRIESDMPFDVAELYPNPYRDN